MARSTAIWANLGSGYFWAFVSVQSKDFRMGAMS